MPAAELERFVFEAPAPLPPQSAYALYAYLLAVLPPALAARIHDAPAAPITQALTDRQWRVTLAGREGLAAADTLAALTSVNLHGKTIPVRLVTRQSHTLEELLTPADGRCRILTLQTPTAFKSGGAYQILPTQTLVLQNALLRWNALFADTCPIEDEGGGLEAMARALVYTGAELHTEAYPLKRQSFHGTVGQLTMENRAQGFHRQLLVALLRFGALTGIGIKTALGMGAADLLAEPDVLPNFSQ